jgi:hypothetical protein
MEHGANLRGAEVRVLGPSGIEDFHAHLMRVDRASRFPGTDDRAIDTHCLSLVATGAILVGLYVDGVMRAAAEIVPDRMAKRADAAITMESGFVAQGIERDLTARVVDEAKRYHLQELRVMSQSETRTFMPMLAMAG